MPGWSLWLVPPKDSQLCRSLQDLIHPTIPNLFSDLSTNTPPPVFAPHITLTSDIFLPSAAEHDAQAWLDGLVLPEYSPAHASSLNNTTDGHRHHLELTLSQIVIGAVFHRKLTLLCTKTPRLAELAACCRAARPPHQGEDQNPVKREEDARTWSQAEYTPHCSLMYSDLSPEIVTERLDHIRRAVRRARTEAQSTAITTQGTEIWLVPTNRPVDEWIPIVRRAVAGVLWAWEEDMR